MRNDRLNVTAIAHQPSRLGDGLVGRFDLNSQGIVITHDG
jgi:hypothetical protein